MWSLLKLDPAAPAEVGACSSSTSSERPRTCDTGLKCSCLELGGRYHPGAKAKRQAALGLELWLEGGGWDFTQEHCFILTWRFFGGSFEGLADGDHGIALKPVVCP